MRLITATNLLSTALVLAACGGGDTRTDDGLLSFKGVSLPYVESIEYPHSVTAGEEFSIRVALSAQANPDILNSVSDEECQAVPRLSAYADAAPGCAISIRPWSSNEGKTAAQIRDHIISTRGTDLNGTDSDNNPYSYAGPVKFNDALAPGW